MQVHGNTKLKNPPPEIMGKGIEHVKWHLRQQRWKERRGAPPTIKTLAIGVKKEGM